MKIDFTSELEPAYIRPLATSILGSDDPQWIEEFAYDLARTHLGLREPVCFHFELSVGAVFGFSAANSSRYLLKVMSPDISLVDTIARTSFQQHLHDNDFPCPRPLIEPFEQDNLVIVAEEFIDRGRPADGHNPADRTRMANKLVDLVALGASYPEAENFPTNRLIFNDDELWPKPHNVLFDFERETSWTNWIDDVAREHKLSEDDYISPRVIGHMDWSAKHCRIAGDKVSVVYDWDSTKRAPESQIVGSAVRSFTYSEGQTEDIRPSLEEMVEFLSDYESARGRRLSDDEVREMISYVHYEAAYSARCEDSVAGEIPHESRLLLRTLVEADLYTVFSNR